MSLTEILSTRGVAAEFARHMRLPADVIGGAAFLMVAPSRHQSYALVGTAFDYCLRFCLAAANPPPVAVSEGLWIAEISLRLLAEGRVDIPRGFSLDCARHAVERARELHAEFVLKRCFNRRLARAALYLAELDRVYRSGPETLSVRRLSDTLEHEVDDLMALVKAIPREILGARHRLVLNPDFGEASRAVGGADADYVIDDTLVDIKTTRSCEVTPAQLHQLVGYRILLAADASRAGVSEGGRGERVTHCGIYFSRHARLVRLRL